MKLIADAKNDVIANCLSNVARRKDSLESEHHREDMKLIADAKNNVTAYSLRDVACSKYSLKSKCHREDMKLIANAKTDEIAACLRNEASRKDSLESEYHKEHMKFIANGKTIYDAAEKIYKEKYRNFSMTFQEKIDAIHQNAKEYIDGDTTKELDDSVFVLK